MSELLVGGMALVYGLVNDIEDNGKSVILTEKIGNIGFAVAGNVRDKFSGEMGFGYFYKENLMPLDGEDFSHEDERKKELTNG